MAKVLRKIDTNNQSLGRLKPKDLEKNMQSSAQYNAIILPFAASTFHGALKFYAASFLSWSPGHFLLRPTVAVQGILVSLILAQRVNGKSSTACCADRK
jgi:hypothetical protein